MTREFCDKQYTNGYLDALYDYAYWRDGELYVGTTGKRYKEVVREIEAKALCLRDDNTFLSE